MPGIATRYQAVRKSERPMPTMLPQEMAFGSPSPRNDRADSVRMAEATMMEALTTMGAMALGRICVKMMRASLMPMRRHDATNSASRSFRNSARTRRATDGHEIAAMAKMMVATDGLTMTTMTIARRNGGMVWIASVMRISSSSTQPPK